MLGALFHTILAALAAAGISVSGQSADSLAFASYKGYPLVMRYQAGTLEHIGIDIFGYGGTTAQEQTLMDFIERYNLQLLLLGNDSDRALQMNLDGVTAPSFFSTPLHRDGPVALSISQTGGKKYLASWGHPGGEYRQMTFPPDYQFLTGKNKIELEDGFLATLEGPVTLQPEEDPSQLPLRRIKRDLYMYQEGTYLIPEISHTRYYQGNKELLSAVSDEDLPIESLYDLLLIPAMAEGWTADVRVLKFGFTAQSAQVPLSQLLGRCQMAGCMPYVGGDALKADEGPGGNGGDAHHLPQGRGVGDVSGQGPDAADGAGKADGDADGEQQRQHDHDMGHQLFQMDGQEARQRQHRHGQQHLADVHVVAEDGVELAEAEHTAQEDAAEQGQRRGVGPQDGEVGHGQEPGRQERLVSCTR